MSAAPTTIRMDKALDGARILWRWFLASESRRANEGHVREFSRDGQFVRVAKTTKEEDTGEWLRCGDMTVVAVLQENVDVVKKPAKRSRRPKREDGEGWKDDDSDELDLGN